MPDESGLLAKFLEGASPSAQSILLDGADIDDITCADCGAGSDKRAFTLCLRHDGCDGCRVAKHWPDSPCFESGPDAGFVERDPATYETALWFAPGVEMDTGLISFRTSRWPDFGGDCASLAPTGHAPPFTVETVGGGE